MQKKITPKPRTLSQPRPIQDYLLSKSRAKPSKPNPSESLYSDAKSRELKNQSLQKSIQANIEKTSNHSNLTYKSQQLFTQNRVKELEEVIQAFEEPSGFISKQSLCKILESLNLILPVTQIQESYVFKTIRAKIKNTIEEEKLIEMLWDFLSPPKDDYIIKELLYDLLAILMDRTCEATLRIEDLARLEKCIGSVNDSSPAESRDFFLMIKEFDLLMDRRKVIGFQRKLEDRKESLQFSFKPVVRASRQGLTGLDRLEALYRDNQDKEDKILCSKLTALEAELNECTFTPSILNREVRISVNESEKCKRKQEKWKSFKEELELEELKECTFKPEIVGQVRAGDGERPRGFEKFVEMQRKALESRAEKDEREKRPVGENYEKNRMSKPNPPSFLSRQKSAKLILMYIDVNLGPGRKGKIAIREDDDPSSLSANFCKIYQLTADYKQTLEQEIRDQLKYLSS